LNKKRKRAEVRYNIDKRKAERSGGSTEHFKQAREQLDIYRDSAANLVKTRKAWMEVRGLMMMLPDHLTRAIQATAFMTRMFPDDDGEPQPSSTIPYLDPPSLEVMLELERSYPNSFVDEMRRMETIKYIEMGTKAEQALSTLFADFDYYAFYNHYSSQRGVSMGMFTPPFNAARRISFEFLTGETSLIPMEIHFPAGEVINDARASLHIIMDRDGVKRVDENVVDKGAMSCLNLWRIVFGTISSNFIDALINREIEESLLRGPLPLVLDTYAVSSSSPEFMAIDTFNQERKVGRRWKNEMFANVYGGTLHHEDVIYKTRRLLMINGMQWFTRNNFLNDAYPFKDKIIAAEQHRLDQSEKRRLLNLLKDTSVVVIQAAVRGYLVSYRYRLAKRFTIKMQRQRRAAVQNREILKEYKWAFQRIKTIASSLEWFFSWENLKRDVFLLNSIDDETCTVSFETLAGFNSIHSVLVGRSNPRDIIEMAARSVDFLFVTDQGIGRHEWLEKKEKIAKGEIIPPQMQIPVAQPVYHNQYHEPQQQFYYPYVPVQPVQPFYMAHSPVYYHHQPHHPYGGGYQQQQYN
jgi:hypothetical protein